MPRRAEIPGKPATERVTFRMTAEMLEHIDLARTGRRVTRGAWLRAAVREKLKKEAR